MKNKADTLMRKITNELGKHEKLVKILILILSLGIIVFFYRSGYVFGKFLRNIMR